MLWHRDIAFILSQGDSQEEKCDTTMYGKLSDGHYRIEKEGMVAEFYVQENTPYIVSEGVSDNVVIPEATNEDVKTYTKWEDFEFDCWPLALGQLRDEWSEESPYWQFVVDKGTPVYRSLFSSNSADWLYGTIIIGINSVD